MAIPRKGTRTLKVEGTKYRWLVRRKPTYDQGLAYSALTVAVEPEAGGRTLVLVFDKPRPDNWLGEDGAVATPASVAAGIRAATAAGWDPRQRGGTLFFELATGELRSSGRDLNRHR